jgi:hypothetical protein
MRAIALGLIAYLACCHAKAVTKLSDSNFEEFRTSAKHVGVLFQRGSDIPEAVTAAAAKIDGVPFGFFDCDWSKAKKTCAKLEVAIFPSFVFFADKEDAEDYYFMPESKDVVSNGDAIVAYVKSRVSKASESSAEAQEAPAEAPAEEADEPTVSSDGPPPSGEGGSKDLTEAQLLAWETKILHIHGNDWAKLRKEHPKARSMPCLCREPCTSARKPLVRHSPRGLLVCASCSSCSTTSGAATAATTSRTGPTPQSG